MITQHLIKSLFIFLLLATNISSLELTGAISSQLYIYEENDSSHIRIYERLRSDLNLLRSPNSKSVDFHLYLRYTSDLKNKITSDPQTYIYDAYIKLRNIPQGTDIRFGRQFVYNSVGSGLLDGIRLKGNFLKGGRLDLYAGSQVSHKDPESIQSLSDFGLFGGMINYQYKNLRLGAHWQLRYLDGSIASHLLGTDISLQKSKYSIFSKFVFNMENKRISEILSRVSYNFGNYYLSTEFQWREPSVSSNSIFSIIDFRNYKEIRIELHRRLGKYLRIVSGLDINLYKDENALSGKIGMSSNNWSLIWVHRSGLGRNSNGINGFISINLNRSLKAYYSGRFSRYKVQELQSNLNDSYMSIVGAELRLKKGFSVKSEIQYLRNGISKNDIRFNLNFTKSFKITNSNSGGQ